MKLTLKLLDEVNMHIVGLSPAHSAFLVNKYAIYAPGYKFSPKYKLGVWDGKIKHFSSTGATYLFLLEEIAPLLVGWGYEIEVSDARITDVSHPPPITSDIFIHRVFPTSNKPIVLREHQVSSVNSLMMHGNGIAIISTGGGKSLCCAAMCHAYATHCNVQTLLIVPDTSLILQTKEVYAYCGLDVGEYSGKTKDINHTHVISTWQALQNNPSIVQQFGLLIVDECFAGHTPILMADYTTKPIQDVQVGDCVISYNIATGEYQPDVVVQLHHNLTKSSSELMYELIMDDGTTLQVTGNHPIMTTIGYVRADELTQAHEIINIPECRKT